MNFLKEKITHLLFIHRFIFFELEHDFFRNICLDRKSAQIFEVWALQAFFYRGSFERIEFQHLVQELKPIFVTVRELLPEVRGLSLNEATYIADRILISKE